MTEIKAASFNCTLFFVLFAFSWCKNLVFPAQLLYPPLSFATVHRYTLRSHPVSSFSLFTLHIIVYLMLLFIQVFLFKQKKTLQLQCILYSTHLHRIFHSKHQATLTQHTHLHTPRAMLAKLLCELPSMLVNYCKVIHVPLNVCICRYFGVFLLAGPSHFKISEKKGR